MTIGQGFKPGDSILELGGGQNALYHPNADIRPGPGVDLVFDFNEPFPIESEKYDRVFANFVMEHLKLSRLRGFVAEIHRVLKPGGTALVITANLLEQCRLITERELNDDLIHMIFGGDPDYCFVSGTAIVTTDGIKVIDDIKEGELVLTQDGTFHKVIAKYKRLHSGEVLKIRPFGDLPFEVTPNHIIPITFYKARRGGVKRSLRRPFITDIARRADKLDSQHDYFWVPKIQPLGYQQIDTLELLGKLPFITGHSQDVLTTHSKAVPRFWRLDRDFGRLVGYFLSEGSLSLADQNNRRKIKLSNTNEEIANDMFSLCNKYLGHSSIRKERDRRGYKSCYSVSNQSIINAIAFEHLFGRLDRERHVGKLICGTPELWGGILEGVIKGDGCTNEDGVEVSSTSLSLLQELKLLFTYFGIYATVTLGHGVTKKPQWHQSYQLRIEGKQIDKLTRVLNYKFRTKPTSWNFHIDRDGHFDIPIREITAKTYVGDTYDLEVADVHNYALASGIAVHNSENFHHCSVTPNYAARLFGEAGFHVVNIYEHPVAKAIWGRSSDMVIEARKSGARITR